MRIAMSIAVATFSVVFLCRRGYRNGVAGRAAAERRAAIAACCRRLCRRRRAIARPSVPKTSLGLAARIPRRGPHRAAETSDG
ncbi:hypothetical protein XM57_24910 [Burkholderia cepacia]|nr:hypothetical protein XM57_24910 [Burkholderia cepacia]